MLGLELNVRLYPFHAVWGTIVASSTREVEMLKQHHGSQRTISATEMRRNFGAIVRRLCKRREHAIITSRGKPVAVLLPMSDYERLTARERLAALDDLG